MLQRFIFVNLSGGVIWVESVFERYEPEKKAIGMGRNAKQVIARKGLEIGMLWGRIEKKSRGFSSGETGRRGET
jgi:hypothetical protein